MAIGEHHPEKLYARNRGVLKMGHQKLHEFASTPTHNLPQKSGGGRMSKTGSAAPLGTGARFKALQSQLSGKKGVYDPRGLAAFIGRRKYGAAKMSKMAAAGRGK
jgi:hypothetical protein